jgi:hypothetical protein
MGTNREDAGERSSTSRLVDSVDQIFRLPLEMTGATWDFLMHGMQSMTGQRGESSAWNTKAGSGWSSSLWGQSDQDLSGDDLKYVMWSIAFTKPGLECVLEPQHEEIVNYSVDGSSFAAVKIAKLLEKARHGHIPKPESWGEAYPAPVSRTAGASTVTGSGTPSSTVGGGASSERGWRIPAEDHKYIRFLYRVDRRLPKQEDD